MGHTTKTSQVHALLLSDFELENNEAADFGEVSMGV